MKVWNYEILWNFIICLVRIKRTIECDFRSKNISNLGLDYMKLTYPRFSLAFHLVPSLLLSMASNLIAPFTLFYGRALIGPIFPIYSYIFFIPIFSCII